MSNTNHILQNIHFQKSLQKGKSAKTFTGKFLQSWAMATGKIETI